VTAAPTFADIQNAQAVIAPARTPFVQGDRLAAKGFGQA
jgi:hypothetical protein